MNKPEPKYYDLRLFTAPTPNIKLTVYRRVIAVDKRRIKKSQNQSPKHIRYTVEVDDRIHDPDGEIIVLSEHFYRRVSRNKPNTYKNGHFYACLFRDKLWMAKQVTKLSPLSLPTF